MCRVQAREFEEWAEKQDGRLCPPFVPPLALNFIHPLTVEELRLDTEELLLSMRSNEGQRPAVSSSSSPFCRISGSAWFWGDPTSGE